MNLIAIVSSVNWINYFKLTKKHPSSLIATSQFINHLFSVDFQINPTIKVYTLSLEINLKLISFFNLYILPTA